MEKIKFTKMHSAGNHYIYLFAEQLKNTAKKKLSKLAIKMSHSKYGVGSDGLVILSKGSSTKIRMTMFNSDGSESAMCGNAICSVAKLLYEKTIEKKTAFSIELGNASYPTKLFLDKNKKVKKVTVQMGAPDLTMKGFINSQLLAPKDFWVEQNFSFGELNFKGTLVSINNPHLVIFCDDVEKIPLKSWGIKIEKDSRFPKRINVEFVERVSSKKVKQRTWERGAGETWACGSGACAVCVAGFLSGKTEKKIQIQLLGGRLDIEWQQEENNIFLTGEPIEVFQGEFML